MSKQNSQTQSRAALDRQNRQRERDLKTYVRDLDAKLRRDDEAKVLGTEERAKIQRGLVAMVEELQDLIGRRRLAEFAISIGATLTSWSDAWGHLRPTTTGATLSPSTGDIACAGC